MLDLPLVLAGLAVGFTVGMTGMGGGALMTPVMILIFGVEPLVAVSSDLVVSLIMKPVGAGVHWRRGTVNRELAKRLVLGSVPAAFLGVVVLRAIGGGDANEVLKPLLGAVLLVAAATILLRPLLERRRTPPVRTEPVVVRRGITTFIGIVGGLVVGMTSVGSGSLVIVMLLLAYPALRSSELVGTDLVQAVPLVASAALGHLLFGEVRLGLTASLVAGAVPGTYLGARLSTRASDRILRPTLFLVLAGSGLKLIRVI